jgi:glycosyltransferase involved in cell wall biosynthesis
VRTAEPDSGNMHTRMRVVVLDRRFSHHGAHSGYKQIVNRQAGIEFLPAWSPGLLPDRVGDAIVRRAGRIAYSRTSMGFELAAARRMLAGPRAVYHVLYGEDDYHHLAAVAPLLRRLGGRLAATFHQPPDVFRVALPSRVAAEILPRLDAALVTTREQAEHLSLWMRPERIHHVPHGVDCAFFTPGTRSRPEGAPFTVISVGSWQRDFILLEQVARAFAEQDGGVRFVVVCRPDVAARLSAVPGVEAHSGVTDERLRELYRSSDALFLPVVQAAANNTLLEALACGLPVIATDLPGVREYAGHAGARLFARFDPAGAIAEIAALAAAPAACAALARRARERAVALDVGFSAARLADVYQRIRPR